MKKSPASTRLLLAAITSAAYLSACMNQSENDDEAVAEVSASVAGRSLNSGFTQTQEWNTLAVNPIDASVMESALSGQPTLTTGVALAKQSASLGDDLIIDLKDTAQGKATLTQTSNFFGIKTENFAVVKWDAKSKDDIKDNENILSFIQTKTFLTGRVEKAEFKDADGDGLINTAAGAASKVEIVFTKTDNKLVDAIDLIVGAGPDGNFDKDSDNTVYKAEWTRKHDGVLKIDAAYTDADNDGVVVDNAKPCVIGIRFNAYEPADRPWVKTLAATAKVKVLNKDEEGIPVSFGYTETFKTGRVNTVSIKNKQGSPNIIANDTLIVHLETKVTSDTDTLKFASIDYVMNPCNDLKNDEDDSLYAIHIQTQKHRGIEREAEFHFWAKTPVLHGQKPVAGRFEGLVTYAGGKSATLKGEFSATGYKADYTGPEGNTVSVEYNLDGELVAQK